CRPGSSGQCCRRTLNFRGQRAKRTCLHVHLATAAKVKDFAALLRCKFDAPYLAAESLTARIWVILEPTYHCSAACSFWIWLRTAFLLHSFQQGFPKTRWRCRRQAPSERHGCNPVFPAIRQE